MVFVVFFLIVVESIEKLILNPFNFTEIKYIIVSISLKINNNYFTDYFQVIFRRWFIIIRFRFNKYISKFVQIKLLFKESFYCLINIVSKQIISVFEYDEYFIKNFITNNRKN